MMVSYASTKGIKYSSLQNCNIRENNSGINIVQIIIIIIQKTLLYLVMISPSLS